MFDQIERVWTQYPKFRILIIIALLVVGIIVIFVQLPEPIQLRVIERWWPREVRQSPIDVAVSEFTLEAPNDSDLLWLRNKIERNLVELLVQNGKRVAHPLAVLADDAGHHARFSGSLGRATSETIDIAARLDDENGAAVSSVSFEAPADLLRDNYKAVPETILYGLDISPKSLRPLRQKAESSGGTRTLAAPKVVPLTAMMLFFEARRKAGQNALDEAIAKLEQAIAIDGRFALAHWAIGEILKAKGDTAGAADRQKQADAIDPDHPRLPIAPNVARPLADLLPALKTARWEKVADGVESRKLVSETYGVGLDAWRFAQVSFRLGVSLQTSPTGSSARKLSRSTGAALIVNGGFFEIDSERRLTPSGLVVSSGSRVGTYQPNAGSALLYSSGGKIGIDWSKNWESLGAVDEAVQAGPMIVDPGGKNGIKANDFNRLNRTAICLAGPLVTAVVVTGGLSLFELGEILAAPERHGGFGCERAINLDGGPSTQAMFSYGGKTREIAGTWRVQNAVAFREK